MLAARRRAMGDSCVEMKQLASQPLTLAVRHSAASVLHTTTGISPEVGMFSIEDQFEQAQQNVNGLAARPDNDTMLKLYALYKQATKGNVSGERPGGFDFVARAKYDAWSEVQGTSANDAMQQYVDLVKILVK